MKINGSRSILSTELNLIDPTHCLALLTTYYKNNLLVLFYIHIYLYYGEKKMIRVQNFWQDSQFEWDFESYPSETWQFSRLYTLFFKSCSQVSKNSDAHDGIKRSVIHCLLFTDYSARTQAVYQWQGMLSGVYQIYVEEKTHRRILQRWNCYERLK